MTNKKNKTETNDNKSFIEKIKTDKKYKAKIEFIGYGIFILVLIIYLNLANLGSSRTYSNLTGNPNSTTNQEQTNDQTNVQLANNPFSNMTNNYQYTVQVDLTTTTADITEETTLKYSGKSYQDNLEIIKETPTTTTTYYQVADLYYALQDETYQLIKEDSIYDLITADFIEYSGLKKYLEQASLDHVTNYSSGKKEYVYHLKVKDLIRTITTDEEVEFNVTSENNIIQTTVDYTNLIKHFNKNIFTCTITYTYQNINQVEEFSILPSPSTPEE